MQKIMIDLDETICTGGYLEAVNAYLHTNYKDEEIDSYYVEDVMNDEQKEQFLDYFYQNVNIYKEAKIIPDSLKVIEKLAKKYDIYITTAFVDKRRVYESGIMARYKYQWIVENMSYFECPDCHSRHSIYGESHVDEIAAQHGIRNIARLPIDPAIAKLCDSGLVEQFDGDLLDDMSRAIEAAVQ